MKLNKKLSYRKESVHLLLTLRLTWR